MKIKSIVLVAFLLLVGCNGLLGNSPTSIVEKFHQFAASGDVDGMNKLYSSKTIKEKGADKINENNRYFSDLAKKAVAAKENPKVFDVKEAVNGDKAIVNFRYGDQYGGTGSLPSKCELVKENGEWKIERITSE
jgi:hypothetical protein